MDQIAKVISTSEDKMVLSKIAEKGHYFYEFNQLLTCKPSANEEDVEEATWCRCFRVCYTLEHYHEAVAAKEHPISEEDLGNRTRRWNEIANNERTALIRKLNEVKFEKPANCYCEEAPEDQMLCKFCHDARFLAVRAAVMGQLEAKIKGENATRDQEQRTDEQLWEEASE